MAHLTYEEQKKTVVKGLIFLGIITIIEVFISLLGKGHLIEGFHINRSIYAVLMVVFSLIKAIYILGEFMHLKYESKALRWGLAIPLSLLLWGAIAFTNDGASFETRRAKGTDEHLPEVPKVNHDIHTPHGEKVHH